MNNLHNIGNVNIPGMNISNNINNSQINYHQYFQFFQNNHSNYNNISYIPNENFAMFMDQPNPQLAHKLIYNNPQGNIQNFFNPNINGMITSLGNNNNSKLNKSLQNPNFFNELSLLNNNPFYQSNFNNAMTSTNINNMSNINSPVFSLEMIKNINDSSNLTNNNSFYQIKNLNMINELLNSNNTQDMKPPQYVLNNNYTKGIVPSKDNGDHIISKSNSSIVTTNNVNNSSSNVMFSVENFLNDKQEKPQSQSLIDKSTKVKKFNCENDSIIIIHEINCIPIRFDIVVDKKILKNYNNDSSKVNNEINLSIDCNYLNKFSPDKSEYVIDNKNSILNGNLSDEEKTILKNKRPRGINDDQEKYNINSSKQNSDNKKEDIQNNNNKIRKIKRYVPNERYSYFDDYNDNNYNCANYKSSLLTYHNFDEKDLEMINSIDNPRRKKNKHKKNNEADKKHFFTTENNQHLINQFNNYLPIFEEELNEHLKCKSHQFMKENFPEMYNIENFYLHVKMIKEKREKKLRSLVIQINQIEITSEGNVKESSFQSDNEFKMVWDCKRLNGTEGK